eukprot:TRINITY_DN1925_c0_g1_i5.p1 TRINITY_DN1925_c0_g1~~TRINITY_DN1925_c0_g1_i5.p1  ORF type:complete len:209 (+),score=-28.10 TRINITY_DN1925_c0_g1_i5:363-989(+)
MRLKLVYINSGNLIKEFWYFFVSGCNIIKNIQTFQQQFKIYHIMNICQFQKILVKLVLSTLSHLYLIQQYHSNYYQILVKINSIVLSLFKITINIQKIIKIDKIDHFAQQYLLCLMLRLTFSNQQIDKNVINIKSLFLLKHAGQKHKIVDRKYLQIQEKSFIAQDQIYNFQQKHHTIQYCKYQLILVSTYLFFCNLLWFCKYFSEYIS